MSMPMDISSWCSPDPIEVATLEEAMMMLDQIHREWREGICLEAELQKDENTLRRLLDRDNALAALGVTELAWPGFESIDCV